jgi:hypothetical protein
MRNPEMTQGDAMNTQPEPQGERKDAAASGHETELNGASVEVAMHPNVYRLALICWLCFMTVFWVTFWVSSNALFQVVIGTVYAVMFFGIPYEMSRIFPGKRTSDKSIWQFMAEPFGTRTGTMRGYEAMLQVIMVPLLLTIGGTAMGIIFRIARAGH